MSNAANIQAFNVDLDQFAKKLNVKLETAVQRLALDAFNRLTKRTPVDTGRARASWTIATGKASDRIPGEGKQEPKGDASAAASIDGTEQVFITSALDYMKYLEKGSSKQAPVGMVAITLAEIEAEIEIILAGIAD